jgi:hypothetical protein
MPVTQAEWHLLFWARISLIAVIPSGLILFMVNAAIMVSNIAFRVNKKNMH